MMMRRSVVPAALLTLIAVPSLGAATFSLSFAEHAAANVFQTSYAERDSVSALDFSLTEDFSAVSVNAGIALDHFARNPGLSFAGLRGGLDYLRPLGSRSALYVLLTASGSFFRPDYRDFDHLSLEAQVAFKSYIGSSSILRTSGALEYRNYGNPLFDFLSQTLTASLDRFFPTSTTLRADLGWGYKYFLHPYPAPEPSTGQVLQGAQYGYGGPQGKGTRGGGGYFLEPGAARGGTGIQSLSVSGLLAQGLGTRLGLSLSGNRQWIVSGRAPFVSSEEFFLAENPIYDDFSWDGWGLGGQLTARGPWDTELKMGYTVSDKKFPGIESMSLEGVALGITRRDRRYRTEVRIEKLFRRSTVFLAYSLVDNRSNDPLFTWKGPFVSAGIRWNLAFGGKK